MLGALNLYAGTPDAFIRDDVDVAEIYATHATNALTAARLSSGLRTALHSRHMIGVAQGILMQLYELSWSSPSSCCVATPATATPSSARSPSTSSSTGRCRRPTPATERSAARDGSHVDPGQQVPRNRQVADEPREVLLAGARAQHRRRVDRRESPVGGVMPRSLTGRVRPVQASAPRLPHAEAGPEDRLAGGRTEQDDPRRAHHVHLGDQPRPAGGDMGARRPLVQPVSAAPGCPPEVLDDVRAKDVVRVDPGLAERPVEQPARRADERLPGLVLLITRLLAHDHERRILGAGAGHAVRRILVELAAPARVDARPHQPWCQSLRDPPPRTGNLPPSHVHLPRMPLEQCITRCHPADVHPAATGTGSALTHRRFPHMLLPHDRGPISGHVIETLRSGRDARPIAIGPDVLEDADAQLALWVLYELHYRGFDHVPDREWDVGLLSLRLTLERRFERELAAAVGPAVAALPPGSDVSADITALIEADDSPSPAAFLQRDASREQVLDFLRERSVQQLKESDPQSFVLPRIDGSAKVALAELQYDEYGGGRPDRLHARLYADALEAAGLDSGYGAYIDEVSALSLAAANVMSLFGLNRRLRGAAMGHLAAFEATSSVPSRKIAAAVDRVGLPDAVAAYFLEHVEADSVHEQVAIRDICGSLVADDPSLRDDVLFGVASCLHLAALSGAELLERWAPELEVAS